MLIERSCPLCLTALPLDVQVTLSCPRCGQLVDPTAARVTPPVAATGAAALRPMLFAESLPPVPADPIAFQLGATSVPAARLAQVSALAILMAGAFWVSRPGAADRPFAPAATTAPEPITSVVWSLPAQRGPAPEVTRDRAGRLVAWIAKDVLAASHAYDAEGRPIMNRYGALLEERFYYDGLGRLSERVVGGRSIAYRRDDAARHATRTLPNGVRTVVTRDRHGNVAAIEHSQPLDPDDARPLLRLEYTYGEDGQLAQVRESGRLAGPSRRFEYDRFQRLVAVVDAQAGRSEFGYDEAGNRVRTARAGHAERISTFDWAGRLLVHGGEYCAYTARQELARAPRARGPLEAAYDETGSLVRAGAVEYGYDTSGNLTRRTAGGLTTRYAPRPGLRGGAPVAEADDRGGVTVHVWEDTRLLASVLPDGMRWYLEDEQGSCRVVLDDSGRVLAAPRYDAWGDPETAPAPGPALVPGFAGLLFDPASGLYLTSGGAYDPELGRMLTRAPANVGPPSLTSPYAFADDDPVNMRQVSPGAHRTRFAPAWTPRAVAAVVAQLDRARNERALRLEPRESGTPVDWRGWVRLAGSLARSGRAYPEMAELPLRWISGTGSLELLPLAMASLSSDPSKIGTSVALTPPDGAELPEPDSAVTFAFEGPRATRVADRRGSLFEHGPQGPVFAGLPDLTGPEVPVERQDGTPVSGTLLDGTAVRLELSGGRPVSLSAAGQVRMRWEYDHGQLTREIFEGVRQSDIAPSGVVHRPAGSP